MAGHGLVYRENGQPVEVTVTSETTEIAGIEARVVHDVVSEEGDVVGVL